MILAAINLQTVLGYSAVNSGLTSLPLSIVLTALAPPPRSLGGAGPGWVFCQQTD
jgi:hypothetical protein